MDLFDNAPQTLVKFNGNGIIRSINVAGADMLCEERSALIGTAFADYLSSDDAENFLMHLQACAVSPGCVATELHLSLRDGRVLWLRLVSSSLIDHGTCESLFLTAITDLTAFKSVMESSDILNAFLAEHSSELADANTKLHMAVEELEAFNSAVAHDLRTPLATIDICAQAVSRHCGNNLDDQCRSYLQNILGQTDYMNQLIRTLMEFSQVSRRQMRKDSVDLSAIAWNIVSQLKLWEPERNVRFRVADRLVAYGDTFLLQEVMDNLIGNAWKYSVMRDPAVIEIGATVRNGATVYFVRDNGIGFDMGQVPKLFKIFSRLHSFEAFGGHGVGLATVQRIIRRHGGRVWAEGGVSQGATFYFTL